MTDRFRCPARPGCAIVPPFVLRAISENGTPSQRRWALESLLISERVRGRREVWASLLAAVPVGKKRRSVYDAKSHTELPGELVRAEGDPDAADLAVNEAYDGSGRTYDFFFEVYGRNSLDGQGMRLDSTVHYGQSYDNAFWDGVQMVYGDGDGELFERFTKALDVIAHEMTHGVTGHEAALEYRGEPGALNESMSDVFGSLVKQRACGQKADEADWIIGNGLFTPRVRGVGLRSLKAPGTAYDDPVLGRDPQPAHMDGFYRGSEDSGGVHINSGIPNHAFYLAATAIGGHAWERAGRIWYTVLTERLRRRSSFRQLAHHTTAVAAELFGAGSGEQKAVREAWRQVGVEENLRGAEAPELP